MISSTPTDGMETRATSGVRTSRLLMGLGAVLGLALFLHPSPLKIAVGLGIIGLFVAVPLMAHAVTPSRVDINGVTLGFGRRAQWKDLRDIQVIKQVRAGQAVNYRFVLTFVGATARFGLNQIENGREVVTFIERATRRILLPRG